MTVPSVYAVLAYGTGLYGAGGADNWLVDPFIARSLNYTSIGLSWVQPTASAARWRLLQNRYGYPADQNDGNILIDSASYPGSFYLDTNVIPGTYHYYALFALVNATDDLWLRAGVTACLAIKSFDTGTWLQGKLPAYFSDYLGDDLTTDAAGNPYLTQYLNVLAWGIDYVKTQYDVSAAHLNDPMAIPLGDLMNLATEIGIEFDSMLPGYLMRKAVLNWAHISQQGGTSPGITAHLSLMTGFGVDLQTGPNLMLEDDQSQFLHPVYPAYDPSIAYHAGERVSYGNYWYACAVGGTVGIAPSGTATSTTNWTVIQDADDTSGILANPVTGWVNTWEPIYPAASNGIAGAGALVEGIGVPNPQNSAQWSFNDIRVKNLGTSAQDVLARSVSRTLTDLQTTTTDWHPDPAQAVGDGIPVPFVTDSQEWEPSVRYGTGDIVTYNGLPFLARRASTGAVPPVNLVATPEWYPLSPDLRLPLMISAETSQSLMTSTNYSVPVTPFAEWYDEWGNFITRIYARTPTAGVPGIPDQLAFDSFTRSPGPSISGRAFDNGYVHTWTAQDGDFKISGYAGGCAYPSVTGTRSMALTTGPSNGQVGVTFVTAAPSGQAQAIVFRFSDENDYWKATTTQLIKKSAGSFIVITAYSTAAQPGDRLVVQMNGSTITVLLNGTQVATVTDAFNNTATLHGIVVE